MKRAAMVAMIAFVTAASGTAQTHSTRDTATAYGARLTAKGQPANLNENRINSRINSRIGNRLNLRIERYRPDSTSNPTAAYQTRQEDKSRAAPVLKSVQQQAQEE